VLTVPGSDKSQQIGNKRSKYSPEDSGIVVGATVDAHELVVVVKDNGLGISREDQKKLFTPFFRSSNEEAIKEKGTGLGLMIPRFHRRDGRRDLKP
jgi:signal transduction histidine kinase